MIKAFLSPISDNGSYNCSFLFIKVQMSLFKFFALFARFVCDYEWLLGSDAVAMFFSFLEFSRLKMPI